MVSDSRIRPGKDGVPALFGPLSGHGLLARGEAYLAVDCYKQRCSTNLHATVHQQNGATNSVAGIGHGVCACGTLSPHLHSYRARRRWHRQHKARVVLTRPEPAGQPRPVNPEAIA